MASSKAALKSVKNAIDKNDFATAAEKAADLVKQDAKNYTGLVFLGFARDKLDQDEAAAKAYEQATTVKPKDPQALKGLVTLYEKLDSRKLDQYHDVVIRLAELYADLDDKTQCQTVIDRYELFARKHGTRVQYRQALELLLPSCSLYSFLEGRIPHPSHTYTRILESAEAEEKEWINSQIGERRTRLGARIDQVTQQVKLEAIKEFQVEAKYRNVIDWIQDDEARHTYEEKLLQRVYDDLLVLPIGLKAAQRDKVLNLANGMVIIKHPFETAWSIALEWVSADTLAEWDVNIFREFIEYFPDNGLSKVLRGFLDSAISPFPKTLTSVDSGSDAEQSERLSEANSLILMVEGLDECPSSLLSHRILAEVYLSLDEFRSAVETARKAQLLHIQAMQSFSIELQNSLDAVNTTLANALIAYQSPRNHPEAKAIFEEILQRRPTATAPLLGIGLILEEEEDYGEAVKFLEQALRREAENLRIRLELAWCHALDQDLNLGFVELEEILDAVEVQRPMDLQMKSEVLYRIGYCKWHLEPSSSARRDKNGAYKYLLDSIKANPAFAPPYTLLGIYFEDYGRSKKRARTAFQKAFELSTSEIEAAERLARAFANGAEWDLVELVAQRVVDSGKAKPAPGSKKKAFSWPYAALGVVEMNNKQQYTKSIVAFQAALRVSPNDYHCWVGLGESYHHSGRYVAASRAFIKAESLDHGLPVEQTWFAKYMQANVQREMGLYDEAVEAYNAVLKIKQGEFGVMIALLQTLTESAWAKIDLGMFGAAAGRAQHAIEVASEIARSDTEVFNLWKAVGDACSVLARAQVFSAEVDLSGLSGLLHTNALPEYWSLLADIDKIDSSVMTTSSALHANGDNDASQLYLSKICLQAAVLAHKRAIHAAAHDVHAQAVSWYNLGWAEHQNYVFASSLDRAQQSQSPRKLLPQQRFLKAALRCFKRAIELEAGNAEFWNALGVVTMTLDARISQHSFVRSLHLNDRSSRVWTNLGALCLLNHDHQLANEAFTRAQSADPEYAHAWLGQGLLATLFGNAAEAQGLFTHAFDIANSSSLLTKRQYALSAFDHLANQRNLSLATHEDVNALIQPLFALHQLHSQAPSDAVFNHLSALFAQRVGKHEEAEAMLTSVCSVMEGEYEQSESTESLARFAQAKADLARSHLARREFASAAECAETALDLSSEEDLGGFDRVARRQWRLSAHLTAGLAHHYLHHADVSVKMFHTALAEADHGEDDPDIICMLAQVLWARGGEEERSTAREQLFDCIERHPTHVGAVTLLGVIALLDEDEDALDAVEDDLRAMRVSDDVDVQHKTHVGMVLAGVTARHNGTTSHPEEEDHHDPTTMTVMRRRKLAEATRGVMLAPALPQGWTELAAAIADDHDDDYSAFPAQMALQNATRQVPPRGGLGAVELSRAYALTGRRGDALQAIMVAPWRVEGWWGLGAVV